MSLLGDDGRGYDLARRLESAGVWRSWLGDTSYAAFVPFLSSPSSWETFMRADEPKSKAQIQLQLRARALLFDKATASLFLSHDFPSLSNSAVAVSKLNPSYLLLHGDDVYYSLEDVDQRQDGGGAGPATMPPKMHNRSSFSAGSRNFESEIDNSSQRFKSEELPETWYTQFIESYKVGRPYKMSFGDRESEKRTPEEMSTYLRFLAKHKKRRAAYIGNPANDGFSNLHSGSAVDGGNSNDDDIILLPEMMFAFNCVPDSALPPISKVEDNPKIEFHGVLDSLPQTKSSVMIERLGIIVEQGGNLHRSKNGLEGNRRLLSQDQASHLSKTVVSSMLMRMGFEGVTEVPLDVLSRFLRCHISKLGRTLKILADSYRKQCSAIELLKMFLRTEGFSNLGILMELVKDGTRNTVPTPQQVHGIQSQLQAPHQNQLRMPQQIPRQMHPQMQHMVHPQHLAFQQHLQQQMERNRRRQASGPRPNMEVDKDRPVVQVKLETTSESPMDGNAFNAMNPMHPQMQLRQQQLAMMSNLHAQSSNQFRPITSMQIPQVHSPNMSMVRAPPVKVEGFSELMGGDSSSRHDSDESKLTSPSSK